MNSKRVGALVAVAGGLLALGCAQREPKMDPVAESRQPAEREARAEAPVIAEQVEGRISHAEPEQVAIIDELGRQVNLHLSGDTRILRQGREISAEQLTPGDPVRASYFVVEGERSAIELEVTPEAAVPEDFEEPLGDPEW